MRKIILVVPFWFQKNNVGLLRVQSFVHWLQDEGYHIVIVAAGNQDYVEETPKMTVVTIKDPLGLYSSAPTGVAFQPVKPRRPNRLRRLVATLVFCPDVGIMWARAAFKQKAKLLPYLDGAEAILSSSPPESAHILACKLSKWLKIPFLLDLRDGWLDDPLKSLLRTSALQRWREGRLEKQVVRQAKTIFVVTERLTQLLAARFPHDRQKMLTLTNSYVEPGQTLAKGGYKKTGSGLKLYHVGRFTASDPKRKVELLLAPILQALQTQSLPRHVSLVMVGHMNEADIVSIAQYNEHFKSFEWSIEVKEEVAREQAQAYVNQADGLLILSVPITALTRKIFEYMSSGRPFLAVTPQHSALWEACEAVPQAFLVPLAGQNQAEANTRISDFMKAVETNDFEASLPTAFTQEYVKQIFMQAFG